MGVNHCFICFRLVFGFLVKGFNRKKEQSSNSEMEMKDPLF